MHLGGLRETMNVRRSLRTNGSHSIYTPRLLTLTILSPAFVACTAVHANTGKEAWKVSVSSAASANDKHWLKSGRIKTLVARPKLGSETKAYPCELHFTSDCDTRCCNQVHAWSCQLWTFHLKMPDHLGRIRSRGSVEGTIFTEGTVSLEDTMFTGE